MGIGYFARFHSIKRPVGYQPTPNLNGPNKTPPGRISNRKWKSKMNDVNNVFSICPCLYLYECISDKKWVNSTESCLKLVKKGVHSASVTQLCVMLYVVWYLWESVWHYVPCGFTEHCCTALMFYCRNLLTWLVDSLVHTIKPLRFKREAWHGRFFLP